MDAAVAEVTVERSLITMTVDQRLEFAQVIAEAQRINGGIFPADHRVGCVGVDGQRGRRSAGFADGPHAFAHRWIGDQP